MDGLNQKGRFRTETKYPMLPEASKIYGIIYTKVTYVES
jgi:hypothetical protein